MLEHKPRVKRGQLASIDALFAALVFLLLFGAFESTLMLLRQPAQLDDALLSAQRAVFMLAESPGDPAGWNSSNVRLLGVADSRRSLNESRLSSMLTLSNATLARLLSAPDYNVRVELRFLNGSLATAQNSPVVIGPSALSNASVRAVWKELVLYKSQRAYLSAEVWR